MVNGTLENYFNRSTNANYGFNLIMVQNDQRYRPMIDNSSVVRWIVIIKVLLDISINWEDYSRCQIIIFFVKRPIILDARFEY